MPNVNKRLRLTPRWKIAIHAFTNLLRDTRIPEIAKDRVCAELEKLAEAADSYIHNEIAQSRAVPKARPNSKKGGRP